VLLLVRIRQNAIILLGADRAHHFGVLLLHLVKEYRKCLAAMVAQGLNRIVGWIYLVVWHSTYFKPIPAAVARAARIQ
jgi:hypothetical protein